jgi:transcriptional regulator
LAIFQGPSAYVSPAWYAAKAEHGRVVPTWNYEAVHVRGRLRWFDDPAGLLDVVQRLTDRFEAGRAAPWSVADAPADYVERLMAGIVGVELTVTAIEGKRKLSQNRPAGDRARIVAGLAAEGPAEQALAARMSAAR